MQSIILEVYLTGADQDSSITSYYEAARVITIVKDRSEMKAPEQVIIQCKCPPVKGYRLKFEIIVVRWINMIVNTAI